VIPHPGATIGLLLTTPHATKALEFIADRPDIQRRRRAGTRLAIQSGRSIDGSDDVARDLVKLRIAEGDHVSEVLTVQVEVGVGEVESSRKLAL
jgi:hypothetical protein